MSYFSMISANSLLAKGKIPNVTNTSKGVSAGFGRFDPLFEIYEFPVQVELINSKNVIVGSFDFLFFGSIQIKSKLSMLTRFESQT